MSKMLFCWELSSKQGRWEGFILCVPSTALLGLLCSADALIVFWHLKSQPHRATWSVFISKRGLSLKYRWACRHGLDDIFIPCNVLRQDVVNDPSCYPTGEPWVPGGRLHSGHSFWACSTELWLSGLPNENPATAAFFLLPGLVLMLSPVCAFNFVCATLILTSFTFCFWVAILPRLGGKAMPPCRCHLLLGYNSKKSKSFWKLTSRRFMDPLLMEWDYSENVRGRYNAAET